MKTKLANLLRSQLYASPECVELEVITEGTVLSASTGIGASSEGYDVDDEKFNW